MSTHQNAAKIPATIITGFLGAGKTTIIRNLLATANGRRIALIVNEFGDLGIDGDILKSCGAENCSEDDIVELTNGCICCTVADDFIPAMEKLTGREIDHIVIETSGLALPQPLVDAFNWPQIRERVTVDGVITVVDARAVAEGRFADDGSTESRASGHESPLAELFKDQLTAADMIVLNKADLVDGPALDKIAAEVAGHAGRAVKVVRAANGSLSAGVLLGLQSATEDEIANRKSRHELELENGGEHDHDEFESFVAETGAVNDAKAFAARLKPVIAAHDILRLKGFAEIAGKPMRCLIQAAGPRIYSHFDRDWQVGEERGTRLVVIGLQGMDVEAIRQAIAAAAR